MVFLTPHVCCFNLPRWGFRINEVLLQVYNLPLPFLRNQASSFLFSCLPAFTLLPSSMQPGKKRVIDATQARLILGLLLLIMHFLVTIIVELLNKSKISEHVTTPDRTIRCSQEVQQQLPGFRPSLERGESDAVERTFPPRIGRWTNAFPLPSFSPPCGVTKKVRKKSVRA